jgi:formyltetrahydrofolate hydrolase
MDGGYVVPARYMRIITPEIIVRFPGRIVNIPLFIFACIYRGKPLLSGLRTRHENHWSNRADVKKVDHKPTAADMTTLGKEQEKRYCRRRWNWFLTTVFSFITTAP